MFSHFIFLSLLSCVLACELMWYVGQIVEESGPIITKKGDECYGTVIRPFIVVTTCSCAVQIGGEINSKVTKLNGKTKFKVANKKDGTKKLNDIISVGIYEGCQDSGQIWGFDIAIAKLKNEVEGVASLDSDLPYDSGTKCHVFKLPGFAVSVVTQVSFEEGHCIIPPSPNIPNNDNSEKEDKDIFSRKVYGCFSGANCNFGTGTPIVCGKRMMGIMVLQDCEPHQNSTAISFEVFTLIPEYELLFTDATEVDKDSGESLTIYSPLLLFITTFNLFE